MAESDRTGLTFEKAVAIIKDLQYVIRRHRSGEPARPGDPSYRDAVKLLMHYKRKLNRLRPKKSGSEGEE